MEIEKYNAKNQSTITNYKKHSFKRKVCSEKMLTLRRRRKKKARPFIPQGTRKVEHAKSKVSNRKEKTKIRVKTNEIEKVNQHKGCTFEKVSKMEEKIAKFIKNKGEVSNKQYYKWQKGYDP